MKIAEIMGIDSVSVGMAADSKQDLLNKLLDLAMKSGKVSDREVARKEILEREKIMSTGVGKAIALPHAKTNAVTDSACALAILNQPIDYDSIDGEPVKIAFLLLGRENNVGSHLRILSKVSRYLNDDNFYDKLLACSSPEEVMQAFSDIEQTEN